MTPAQLTLLLSNISSNTLRIVDGGSTDGGFMSINVEFDDVIRSIVFGSAVGVRHRLWQLSSADLREAAIAVSAEIGRMEAIRVVLVDQLALRPDEAVLSHRGVGSWLGANTMLQYPAARRIAALGEGLRAFPQIEAQVLSGECSLDHAALIVKFCESPPRAMPKEALPQCIDVLLAAAHGVEATTSKIRYVIATLERLFESDEVPIGEDVERNELRISQTLNGRIAIRGDVDSVTGEMLLSALSNLTMPTPAADGTPDRRSAARRTADGFSELIRRYLDSAKTGIDGGQRPHLNVLVDARDLAEHRRCVSASEHESSGGRPDSLDLADLDVGHMPWFGPLSLSHTRLLGCDCALSVIRIDENGVPLDVSPTRRLVSAAQRTALIVRDRGCAFPGCDCPPSWTDAHHIHHWADGGLTVMHNLVLLCRKHHRLMHRTRGFTENYKIVMGQDKRPWFIPPSHLDPRRTPMPANTRQRTARRPGNESTGTARAKVTVRERC